MKNSPTRSLFGDISKQQFLSEYWQKKPLLIRGALPDFRSPISADELAGLACEDEVESRIVIEKGGNHPWELRHGPFEEHDFSNLPESHWTLLLQEANKQIPELAELLDIFNFIPSWWLDDIMISYSPDQGTVGPHYDRYDVFLLQVEGRKNWQINTLPVDEDNVIDDIELRIMKTFHSEDQWTLEAGDILYLPPGVAHHGVAQGESLTYSIGYRALSQSELLASYFDFILEQHDGKRHLSDPALTVQAHPSEITPETIKRVTMLLREMPLDSDSIGRWFGRFITEPNQPMARYLPEQPFTRQQCLQHFKTNPLTRHAHCRFNFITLASGAINLYIDGDEHLLNPEQVGFGHIICDQSHYCHQELSPYLNDPLLSRLLLRWISDGALYFTDEKQEVTEV
ncbi:MAG: cupin domain-containing protein [Gammaproteobacteria bacterium]|nr:cupin domain-containing protein [Gammaproteobacteria bacterium]